jgi:predicted SprT family Zn-dependent metalloprotease
MEAFAKTLTSTCATSNDKLKDLLGKTDFTDPATFKANKVKLTWILLTVFNSALFDGRLSGGSKIIFTRMLKSTAGMFKYDVKKKTSKILLSAGMMIDCHRLRDTLIHEMCHSAVRLLDGNVEKTKPHGKEWKRWTKRAESVFPHLPKITLYHAYPKVQTFRYKFECNSCAKSFHVRSTNSLRETTCKSCKRRTPL